MVNNFRLKFRHSFLHSSIWVNKNFPNGFRWERGEHFTEEFMLEIVRNAFSEDISLLLIDYSIPETVLNEIIQYDYSEKTEPIIRGVINHPNVTPTILEQIFVNYNNINQVKFYLAYHKHTPASVLVKLLPTKDSDNISNPTRNTGFDWEAAACVNPNTPVWEALVASQWVAASFARNILWSKRYPELIEYIKITKNVDYTDFPEEWVKEIVLGGMN